jgi:glycosyltransferase involved in cell wall biosynthesis
MVEIVGDGEERANLEALAAELGIVERVEFRGHQPFAAVRDAMNRATLLVHPSDGLGDGLPNVVREGMALGAPVVASEVAGIPDALRDGCGILVPPKNAAALADALEMLLRNAEMRRRSRAPAAHGEKYDLWQNGAVARLLESTRRPTTPADLEPQTHVGHEARYAERDQARHCAPSPTHTDLDPDWASCERSPSRTA